MRSTLSIIIALAVFPALLAIGKHPRMAPAAYATMAPLDQYLMNGATEIALARSAAPMPISGDATVYVLGRDGYRLAVHGTNGFTCMVFRSWTAGRNDPDFWNPKIRAPLCMNAPAARTYAPIMQMRTKLLLTGSSKDAAFAAVAAALDSKQLAPLEPGGMCYMMSKAQYVAEAAKNWHPHLMFFMPTTTPPNWGANLKGSPILEAPDPDDRLTIYLVPVTRWSDGSNAPPWLYVAP